jgi:hypothetical protein
MVGLIMLLLAFGLVMLYSASSYTASMRHGSALYFVRKQVIYSAIGFVLMLGISMVDYHFWTRTSKWMYGIALILCIYVIFKGAAWNNSARWISLKFVSIQPSEIGKIAFGYIYNDKEPDTEKAIDTALLAYEDGIVRLFINGVEAEYKEEGTPISLSEGDEVTFVRLAMLAGRMW